MPLKRTRRTTRRRTSTRKRVATRRRPRTSTRLMKRVAQQQINRAVETKRYAVINEDWGASATGLNNGTVWTYKNIFSALATGNTSWSIVGNEILNPMIKLKGRVYVDWDRVRNINNVVGPQDVYLTTYIIASNEQLEASSPTFLPSPGSNDFGWFYQRNGVNPTLNGNNVKVLAKRSVKLRPQVPYVGLPTSQITGASTTRWRLGYRWKRKLSYEDIPGAPPTTGGPTRAALLRGWNYYILQGISVAYWNNTTFIGRVVNSEIDTFMYYKDP